MAVAVAVCVLTGACTTSKSTGGRSPRSPRSDGFVDREWFRARQDDYLRVATRGTDLSPLGVLARVEHAARDKRFHFDASRIEPADYVGWFKLLDGFEDTADFDLLYQLNLWFSHRHQLPTAMRAAIEKRVLSFKYWYTEPTPAGRIDQRWYWSENHRVIFHTLELLAGQAFPRRRFTNDGRTGAEHEAHARKLLLQWFSEKARFGFSEWHSDVYYQKDVTPLLTLVEFADDPVITRRASTVLDLVLLDIALHNQKGDFGATHGRSYMKDKSIATDQNTFGIAKLLFDDTELPYPPGTDPGATLLARARKYRLPEVIRRIAKSDLPMVDRERMGVPLDALEPVAANPKAPYGYSYDDPANVAFWFERGALTSWQVLPLTVSTSDRYDLWATDAFKPFGPFRKLAHDDRSTVQHLAHDLAPMIAFPLLSEVNTYTWRGREAMLSTAQDYRPGMRGDQYHAWQATLDGEALVFTTHPENQPQSGDAWVDGDGYWTGTGSMPRSAQQGRASIQIYAPAYDGNPTGPLSDFGYLPMTHAWFPTERFDQVVRDGHWTFGRKGDGYVALWSWRPVQWRLHDPAKVPTGGLTEPFDLVAPGGADDVWIAEVGERSHWKSFDAFRRAVVDAGIDVRARPKTAKGLPGGFDVRYDSPSEGLMRFGTTGQLSVKGRDIALNGYPRMDNPFTTVAFEGRRMALRAGDLSLTLDTKSWTRTAAGPGK